MEAITTVAKIHKSTSIIYIHIDMNEEHIKTKKIFKINANYIIHHYHTKNNEDQKDNKKIISHEDKLIRVYWFVPIVEFKA